MVQNIKELNIPYFPDVTYVDKWVLAINNLHTESKGMIVLVMHSTIISAINDTDYIVSYSASSDMNVISNSSDVDERIKVEICDYDHNLSFNEDHLLYVSDSLEELIVFVKNVIDIHNNISD